MKQSRGHFDSVYDGASLTFVYNKKTESVYIKTFQAVGCGPKSILKLLDMSTAAAAVILTDDTDKVFMSVVHWFGWLTNQMGEALANQSIQP